MSSQLKIVKNVIKDGSGNVIVDCFPENVEKIVASADTLSTVTFPITVYPSYEVALLRVYFYNDEWHISTTKKIDAFSSYWSSDKSFGRLFEEEVEAAADMPEIGLDVFLQSLDKTIRYFILIPLRGSQRSGSEKDTPKGTFWLAGIQRAGSADIDLHPAIDQNLWRALPQITFETASDFLECIKNSSDEPAELTGFMLCEKHKFTRFVTSEYLYRCSLRNNEPNLYKRCLELLNTGKETDIGIFYEQHKNLLDPFFARINNLISFLHSKYIERYIKKEYQIISKRFHVLIKTFHEEYIKSNFTRITQDKIKDILLYRFPARFVLNTLAELDH
jgi:hypothetical protein